MTTTVNLKDYIEKIKSIPKKSEPTNLADYLSNEAVIVEYQNIAASNKQIEISDKILVGFLSELGFSENNGIYHGVDVTFNVTLAQSEMLTNAVKHAYKAYKKSGKKEIFQQLGYDNSHIGNLVRDYIGNLSPITVIKAIERWPEKKETKGRWLGLLKEISDRLYINICHGITEVVYLCNYANPENNRKELIINGVIINSVMV